MRIVLAEDGPENARIVRAVLEKEGYEVIWFQSGTDAYDYLIKNELPDLLITDIMMPGMSGFELLARLKSENRMPPSFVLTGKRREEDIIRGLELGVLDYITKPFSPSVIVAKVKNAFSRKTAA